jgi:hypothetical protein
MGAEAALVRIQFMSGTHAIASALYGVLRPGDELLAVAGAPYDTMEEVIGLRGTPGQGSLAEWGVSYRMLPLADSGKIDWEALKSAIKPGGLGPGCLCTRSRHQEFGHLAGCRSSCNGNEAHTLTAAPGWPL